MKLAAIDLDGTLLNRKQQLLSENTAALKRFEASGGKLVIATGRSLVSSLELIRQMGINAYLIALNGTCIVEIQKGTPLILKKSLLEMSEARTAFTVASQEKISFIASNEKESHRVLYQDDSELVQEFLVQRPDLKNFEPDEMKKMLADSAPKYLKLAFTNKQHKNLIRLKDQLASVGLETIFSDTYYIEYLPNGVNKGSALSWLANRLAIDSTDIFAIGDQENDKEMLLFSGTSVAMGNAVESVKEVADHVTETNDEAGVAKALERFM